MLILSYLCLLALIMYELELGDYKRTLRIKLQ